MANKYRIREYRGLFSIEVQVSVRKGFLWWKKNKQIWRPTNMYGGAQQTSQFMHQPSSKSYLSLADAKKCVEEWKKGDIYHYL